jgi:hypothetical protein
VGEQTAQGYPSTPRPSQDNGEAGNRGRGAPDAPGAEGRGTPRGPGSGGYPGGHRRDGDPGGTGAADAPGAQGRRVPRGAQGRRMPARTSRDGPHLEGSRPLHQKPAVGLGNDELTSAGSRRAGRINLFSGAPPAPAVEDGNPLGPLGGGRRRIRIVRRGGIGAHPGLGGSRRNWRLNPEAAQER